MNPKPSKNLQTYLNRLKALHHARELIIDEVVLKSRTAINNFTTIERELFNSALKLRKALKNDALKPGVKVSLKVLPGNKDRIKIRGPELWVTVSNTKTRELLPLLKVDANSLSRKLCNKGSQSEIATLLLQVGQLNSLYDHTSKVVHKLVKLLCLTPSSDGPKGRGYDDFVGRRSKFLLKVHDALSCVALTYRKTILKLEDPIFEFNSIGGKNKRYHGLSLSWDVPQRDEIKAGLYLNHQLTFKFVAYNLRGGHITRPLKKLDSSSHNTIRPTRRVIKELGIDRFRRPILEWVADHYHLIPDCHNTLQRIALLEEVIADV